MYTPSEDKKDFECATCKAEWTQLDVASTEYIGPMGFECPRCRAVLKLKANEAGASTGHQKQSRLMSQLQGLLAMLQKVDAEDIPNNTFERAYENRVPVPRDDVSNPGPRVTVPMRGQNGPPTTVRGMAQVALEPLKVSVTANSELTPEELAAEAEEKAKVTSQNALPDWHVKSTVTGEQFMVSRKESDQQVNGNSLIKDEEEEKKDNMALNDELATYYAQLAREKEQEAKEEQEAEESSGDDDEDDFEDVGIEESRVGTPSSSTSTPQHHQVNDTAHSKHSESGSSAATPADTRPAIEEEGPAAKKVKFETQEKQTSENVGTGSVKATGAGDTDKDSDEDEEAEFEDAF